MKKVLLLSFIFLAACENNNSQAKVTNAQTSFEDNKYLGAVIFEGGKGPRNISLSTRDQSMPQGSWRAYICLKKTDELQKGSIELDISQLSKPPKRGKENSFLQTLDTLKIDYSYTAKINKTESLDRTVYDSVIKFNAVSNQNWKTTFDNNTLKENEKEFIISMQKQNFKIFDFQANNPFLSGSLYEYTADDGEYYLSSKLLKSYSVDSDESTSVIEECETRDSASFIIQ